MEHHKQRYRKLNYMQIYPSLLLNDEKLKDPTNGASAFNNFFITITEKLTFNTQRKEMLA
jgi:hypothetical protein